MMKILPDETRKRCRRVGLILPLVVACVSCGGGSSIGISNGSEDEIVQLVPILSDPIETDIPDTGNIESAPVVTVQSIAAQEILANAIDRNSIRIMSVGDSITQGTSGYGSYRREFSGLMENSGCSHTMVGSQSSTLHTSDHYGAHEGYSGHKAEYFLLTTVDENQGIRRATDYYRPDVILLHVGSVDVFKGDSAASTVADIDQIIATILDTKPDTIVLVANVIPRFDNNVEVQAELESLAVGIEQLVNESNYTQLSMVDVRSGYTADMMQADLIHPNDAGDAHIADAFFDKLLPTQLCN